MEKIGIISLTKRILLQGSFMRIFLILVFTLFPSIVFSKIGDVYYCTGKILVRIENFKSTQYKPQNFKFRRTQSGLIFGSEDGYFKNFELLTKEHDYGNEQFRYRGPSGKLSYKDGVFHSTFNNYDSITSLSGTCSIF